MDKEEFDQSIFEQVAIGICHSSLEGKIVWANRKFCELTGYSRDELIRLTFWGITHPDDLSINEDHLNKLLKGEIQTFLLEKRYIHKDGSLVWVNLSVSLVRDNSGAPSYLLGITENITARKQIEAEVEKYRVHLEDLVQQRTEQLQASEARYHNLFENNHTVMLLIDPQTGAIVDANPAAVSFYGYPRQDLLQLNISDLNTLPECQIKKEMELARTKQRLYFNFKHRLANNEIHDVEVYSGPINIGGKQLLYSVIHDNTGRKRVEEALDHERRLLRTVIDNIPDQIFARDRDCRFTLNNLRDARIMGVDHPETMLGKNDHDFFPPELADRYQADDRLVMESDQPLRAREEPIVTSEGEQHWVSTTKVPLHDSQGRVIGLVGIAHDITDRKQADEALRISEERYRNLFEEAIEGIVQTTPEGKFLNANKSYFRMMGYDSAEEMIHSISDVALQVYANPEDRARMLKLLATQDRVENFEFQAVRKDGHKIWLSFNLNAIRNQSGELVRFDSRVVDITRRKLADEWLKHTNEKLTSLVSTLEQRNHEANLLHEMDDLLQTCNVPEEAYMVVEEFGALLFPSTCGALVLISNLPEVVEAVATWGENLQSERFFSTDDCWVLRRGRVHYWSSLSPGLRCNHVSASFTGDYLDIPMLAAGELLGMLHIESSDYRLSDKGAGELGQTITEHLALSLSNIRLREKLRAQSIRDPLTGLFNRRFMEEYFVRELNRAHRKQSTVGVIMMDIDHFKDVNDTYGHNAGDEVLRELGAMLEAKIRGGDIACRYGGEEFILILPEASIEVTQQRAEQIREAVRNLEIEFHRKRLRTITVSLGVAVFPEHGNDSAVLISMADKALYKAKRNGRDRVEVAES